MDRLKSIRMERTQSFAPKIEDRPIERVRFATPQAEKRYKKIVRQLQQTAAKSQRLKSLMEIPLSLEEDEEQEDDLDTTGNKKRKCTENSVVPRKKRKTGGGKFFDDPFIKGLGPIPPENSRIFEKMSFVLCFASDSDQCDSKTEDCDENGEWTTEDEPFYSEDRLTLQLNAGGGQVYQSFDLIPIEEHERTKLITNAPSLHPERMFCLEAGIPAYSHRWVIKCCQQNKTLDPSEDEIPALDSKLHYDKNHDI